MSDYSKPIGWWCSIFGGEHSDYRMCHECIPVYDTIPEHLRPETHDETHECVEVVTLTDHGGDCCHNSADVSAHRKWEDCADSHWCNTGTGSIDPKRINDLAGATAKARR